MAWPYDQYSPRSRYSSIYNWSWLGGPPRRRTASQQLGLTGPPAYFKQPEQPSNIAEAASRFASSAYRTAGEAIHTMLAPIGLPKQGVDWLMRQGAKHLYGLELPETATTEQVVRDIFLPGDPSRGGFGLSPESWAKQLVLAGARAAGVDPKVVREIERRPTFENMVFGSVEGMNTAQETARRASGAVGEFGVGMAMDPVMAAMGLPGLPTRIPGALGVAARGVTGATPLSIMGGMRGSALAEQLATKFPGIWQYAAKAAPGKVPIGEALVSAMRTPGPGPLARGIGRAIRVSPEKVMRASETGIGRFIGIAPTITATQKGLHYGFMGSMGMGALEGGKSAIEAAARGDIPAAAEAAVHGVGSGLMATLGVYGGMSRSRKRARVLADQKKILPAQPLMPGTRGEGVMPTDRLPDNIRPEAEAWASQAAAEMIEGVARPQPREGPARPPVGPGAPVTDPVMHVLERMPEYLRPHMRTIWEQARWEAQAIRGGREFVERVQRNFPEGEAGVVVEPGNSGLEKYVVQRNEKGQVEGAAHIVKNEATGKFELGMVAGGKILPDAPSIGKLFEKLDELGVERKEDSLTVLGAKARRRAAERRYPAVVLESRFTPEEFRSAQQAAQDFYDAGLEDALLGLIQGPAYATERPFFSQLRKVVEAPKTQGMMPGSQWLKFLSDPKRGVKPLEMKWTGLDEYLKTRGGERVTKEEIQQFLRENEVTVTETMRGGDARGPITLGAEEGSLLLSPLERERYGQLEGTGRMLSGEEQAAYDQYRRRMTEPTVEELRAAIDRLVLQGQRSRGERARRFFDQADRLEQFAEQMELGQGPHTKFAEYTLPGGERGTYRELVITKPSRAKAEPVFYDIKIGDEIVDTGVNRSNLPATRAELWKTYGRGAQAVPSAEYAERATPEAFVGGHFPEPNVLAHVRFNERRGPRGERILFVEEVQSDWAQKGRREGFARIPEDLQKFEEWVKDKVGYDVEVQDRARDTYQVFNNQNAVVVAHSIPKVEAERIAAERNAEWRKSPAARAAYTREINAEIASKVPPAPFVERTEDWTNLAMKRVLKYAADNGYDSVAWTRGEQQAARYDLSKHIDSLQYLDHGDGNYTIAGLRRGSEVLSRVVGGDGLANVVGKDLADKILAGGGKAVEPKIVMTQHAQRYGASNRPVREFSGVDLKVGGEGMRGYYDKILPSVVGKLGKKFGASVGETVFDVSGQVEGKEFQTGKWAAWGRDEIPRSFGTEAEAKAFAEAQGGDYAPQAAFRAHSIPITPQMRETVGREGFALFATEKGQQAKVRTNVQKLLLKLYPQGSKITILEDQTYRVTLPDKRQVIWRPGLDHIEIDLAAFERERGRAPEPGERAAGATYRLPNAAVVDMVEGVNPRIAIHEHWHVIKHLGGLTDKQRQTLDKKFKGNEEAEADAYAEWFEAGMKEPNTIFRRIYQAVRNLYDSVTASERAVFREATEQLGARRGARRVPSEAQRYGREYWKRLWGPDGPVGKQREVAGEMRAVGAPPGIYSADGFLMLKDRLVQMAREGEVGKNWYPDSSRMLLRLVGGDRKKAEVLAQLVGIFSPQNKVLPNLEDAIRAWNQYLSGEPITAGRTSDLNAKANQLLYEGKDWDGRKTNNFYGNLMLEIDPTNPILKDMVTADVHILRAFGYPETRKGVGAPGERQYDWIEKMHRDIAYDLGWEPHQVQAAIWTSQKYRSEVLPKVKPGETPPDIQKYDFSDAARDLTGHINMEAVPHPTTAVLPELQGADFETRRAYTEGFFRDVVLDRQGNDRIAQLLGFPIQEGYFAPGFYEGRAEPGFRGTSIMPKESRGWMAAARELGKSEWNVSKDLRKAPEAAKKILGTGRYYLDRENNTVYVDPAKSTPETKRSEAAWNALEELTGDPAAVAQARYRMLELDPATIRQVERYAAAFGYVARQEGVGYGRPFPSQIPGITGKQGQVPGYENALYVDMGRKLTDAESIALMEAMARELGVPLEHEWMGGVFPKTLNDGVALINFSDKLDNAVFKEAAERAVADALPVDNIANTGYYREVGGYIGNDWKSQPRGEGYVSRLAEAPEAEVAPAGPSPLLQGLERIRADADAYNSRFASERGWPPRIVTGGAGDLAPGVGRAAVSYATERAPGVGAPEPVRPPGVAPSRAPIYPGGLPRGGRPVQPGEGPRVERRVETLEEAKTEQRRLGIPAEDLILARDQRRSWKSLDPEVRKKIIEWDDESMLNRIKRGHLDDVEVMALDAVVRGRREAKEMARLEYLDKKGTAGEDAAWRQYAQALGNFVALERANVNDGTGTARALAARARIMEAAQTGDRQFLRQVFREFPGVTEADAYEMLRMFENGDPRLSDAIRAATAGRWKQWQTLLRAFLITPSSEFANTFGNTILQGVEVADRGVAAGVDWLVSAIKGTQRERYIDEVGAELSGMLEVAPQALRDFLSERFVQIYKRAWKGESKPIELGRRLEYQVSPFKGKLGRLFATSLDALQAGDELFQAPIANGELLKRALRLAKKKLGSGASKEELQAETLEIARDVKTRPEKYGDLLNDIRSSTQRRLFRDKPWRIVDMLRDVDRRYPWMTAVLPFVRTPANIARYAIHHSPIGFLTPDVVRAIKVLKQKPVKGKLPELTYEDARGVERVMGQGEAVDVLASRVTGTLVFGTALAAAAMGKITGSGPADFRERRVKEETGWRPYSMVWTNPLTQEKTYIPISRFDPIAQMLGVAADIWELPGQRDASDIVSKAIGSIAENFTNRTYLKGLLDWSEALSDPLHYGGQYALGMATMHIPRQLGRLAMAIDPVVRDVRPTSRGPEGFIERAVKTAARNVPGISTMLPARYGPTGEPIVRPGEGVPGFLQRGFMPMQISGERKGRELEGEMAAIGYVPPEPRNYMTVRGEQIMLEREHLELLHRADRNAAYELRRLIRNPLWARLPDTIEQGGSRSKEGIIRKTYDKYRDLARQMVLRSYTFQKNAQQQLLEKQRQAIDKMWSRP